MKHLDFIPKAKKTSGSNIILEDNKILVDGVSSWWTACHGYNHPHIIKAMKNQLEEMPHIMFGGLTHSPAEILASKLVKLLKNKYQHVFFVDSGSVAVEVAMKMAVQYSINKNNKVKNKFISFKHSYHGDTLGAMSVCDPEESMHSLFKGYLPEQINLEIPENSKQKKFFLNTVLKNKELIAAIIIEPLVQCAGGFKFHSLDTLEFISNIARDNNILFILDEIATGFGRTGSMFAMEQANIYSDILCIGKALTGGCISLGAVMASDKIYNQFYSEEIKKSLMHGPTYMANPLACSAAIASLELFEQENRLEQVKSIEIKMKEELIKCLKLEGVKDVRVKGALGVVQVEKMHNLNWLKKRFIDKGVWIRPFLDVIYLMPSFIISDKDLQTLLASIIEIIPEWSFKFNEI